jgi:hypothetical protein
VLATDFLPNSLYSTSTATIISTPVGWGADFVGSATGLLYRLFTTNDTALAIGQAVTGRFTIAAGPNVSPNLRATNVVRAVADTIYGSTPTGIVSRGDSVTNTALLVGDQPELCQGTGSHQRNRAGRFHHDQCPGGRNRDLPVDRASARSDGDQPGHHR